MRLWTNFWHDHDAVGYDHRRIERKEWGVGSLKHSLHWLGLEDAIPRPRLRTPNDSHDDEADKKVLNAG